MDTASTAPVSADDARCQTIPEIVQAAYAQLPPEVWDYSCGGAESEVTLRRNRDAFERIAFRPRVLRDVRTRDTSTTFLGMRLSLPVMLAPIGSISLFDPDGALACARAAEKAGTAAFVGSLASPVLESVAAGTDAPLFFQLYLMDDPGLTRELVTRAEAAGYRGICLTVDSAVYGRRERDLHRRFRPRERAKPNLPDTVPGGAGDSYRAGATWADLEWLCSLTSLPVMVKGITNADDAGLAVDHGARVVYVSNHGGRQLDHNLATIEVLPEIVDVLGGRVEVVMDSGIMRGTDVVKALALGARAVCIGKLMAWALAAGGAVMAAQCLELLRLEMSITMANIGAAAIADLSPALLRPSIPPPAAPWPVSLR